jgi:CRISPR/Cas system endoribonuclease Cas6 (RAMP superfamily)
MSSQNESQAVLIQWADKPQGGKYFAFYFLFIQACPQGSSTNKQSTKWLIVSSGNSKPLALEILNRA